ncbi:family 10 glycosylhydrolase [Deinococcus budaensis]|uniref:Uncharacterized lipoprotein YddW (UPF0748 family) n=1 Tax=Deinococcus budaensis TaxID=1665626 RepID=A0A7W8GE85_9DEIO|nr:family 10 glycosylhydrolase [Deinococcus budaensis]MBB5233893.1 uncharacterized lipoprotein YddW (UPF0748 family) [Deinococcus budaensis]
MTRTLKFAPLLLAPLILAACGGGGPRDTTPREVRGLWVDAFGPGLKTPAEVDLLVADARKMNVNVLFAQVGRRGDCYCNNAAMPRTNDPAVPAGFDPLADLLTKAHAQGIQVHAWIITTALWNSAVVAPPPGHAFHAHGPTATGRDNWLTLKADGTVKAGADWVMDPGHPDAAEYIKNMYVSVVKNYDVDGIQFDRVRYPDFNPVGGPVQWGYNETALERYRAESGTSGTPDPADPAWSAWRRQQVTNLVRETALAVKAVRPDVSVNAATITYGAGPADEAAFRTSRPYAEVGQDWLTWVEQGYLDLNVMMNYKRDFVADQALWFGQWNAFAAGLLRKYPDVGQVSGAAIYLNDQASSVNQIRQTQAAGLSGWAGYSYRTPDRDVNEAKRTKEEVIPELAAKLSGEGGPFEKPARWDRPDPAKLRAVGGRVTVASGPLGGRTAVLLNAQGSEVARTQTDGNGRYGFLRVPEGELRVKIGDVTSAALTAPARRVTAVPDLALP